MTADLPLEELIHTALRKRSAAGRHLHHRDCIHNLPHEEQVALRGWTVERWTQVIGPLTGADHTRSVGDDAAGGSW